MQIFRLILAGVFDRFPDLRIITGHWGEVVLFYLDRIDLLTGAAKLPRKISEYFRGHISVTPSGLFSQRYLRWAMEVVGVDNILFSTDYPFATSAGLLIFFSASCGGLQLNNGVYRIAASLPRLTSANIKRTDNAVLKRRFAISSQHDHHRLGWP